VTSLRDVAGPALRPVLLTSALDVGRSLLTMGIVLAVTPALGPPHHLPLALLATLLLLRGLCAYLVPRTRAHSIGLVRHTAQRLLYRHLVQAGPAARDTARTGDLTAVITDGVERVAAMVGRFFPLVIRGAVVPITVAVVVMTLDVWTGVAMLVLFPAIPGALRTLERGFREAGDRLRRSRDGLAAAYLDAVQGLPTLAAFGRTEEWGDALAERSEQVRSDTMAVLRVNLRALIWVDLVYSAVSVVLVVGVLAWRTSVGALDAADAVTVVLLSLVAVAPLVDVVSFFYVGALGLAAMRRLSEVAGTPVRPVGSERPGDAVSGRLRLENVGFAYDGGPPALRDVSLTVEPGTSVALVGRSGAGKSTLASLVLGLRRPDTGRILVDGHDISDCHPDWLADRVSYVGQATHVFGATVADNLRIAHPDASTSDLAEACRMANVLDVVERLPYGFDTVLGERGTTLSGGEAQRLGIARAFLADPAILILDEATADLDLETEASVTEAIHRLMAERTVIVVAHRITTVRACDLVVHLEDGSVAVAAPPSELSEGFFGRMRSQPA
jgi:ABC-type transport system involved in cytochrome bd biosynthesis fused ATPase/permease subunit